MHLISSCLFIVKIHVRNGGFWDSWSYYLSVASLLTNFFFFLSCVLSYRHRTEEAQRCFQENLWSLLLYDPAVLHQGSSRWWGPSQSCWGELGIAVFLGSQKQWLMGSWVVLGTHKCLWSLIVLLPIFYAASQCTFCAWKWFSRLWVGCAGLRPALSSINTW